MINNFTTFTHINKFFSEQECSDLIRNAIAQGSYQGKGKVGGPESAVHDYEIRDSELYFFRDRGTENKILKTVMDVNRKFWNFSLTELEILQLGIYQGGGHYSWHSDNVSSYECEKFPRKISFSLLLNSRKEFKGGELELETWTVGDNGKEDIPFTSFKLKPPISPGTLIVFPSYVRHRVLPVTEGIRYSLVGWVKGPDWV